VTGDVDGGGRMTRGSGGGSGSIVFGLARGSVGG
jgi:hypothetical protein